ncbi:inositol monophosphatase family protein [Paeniglutamicibacter cryotolerans]|uniref:Myo-inositol-1(Or 4)-monophosphatase n=1 Tax=Paeniglutamicibacter cryotolerans TaxID=670079 RepID=A0A839QS06_9MICC|nr:inositol monophosphatase family protein [Paeniglutamicibacter cryotolerans]MBB2996042.1 myo-inositol-1(or 4)-monophosphatase [Paeniglutamicibacter cryotolerans]
MGAPDIEELLAIARTAAAAGAAVLAERSGVHIDTETKSAAGDWVTGYDRAAEQAVREVITAARPHDAITGEEYGSTVPQTPSDYRWSIDPLDGTANFVRGIRYYATSVAVAGPAPDGNGETAWLAGVVQAPALGQTYWASRGRGAWLADAGGVGHLAVRRLHGPDPGETARILASGFGYDAERRKFQLGVLADLLPGFANIRRIGSAALDLCLVADGTIDAYAEYGTGEHDWSAGALIAEESGVPVLRPESDPGWQAAGYVDFSLLHPPRGRAG